MLRFLTAGESHGPGLAVIVDGLPAGLAVDRGAIDAQLRRRQGGYGRGRRMAIEHDAVAILAGVRHGLTLGSPVALVVRNRDWANWEHTMAQDREAPEGAGGARRAPVTRPRPGHADLAGAAKHGHADVRNVLERASARETAARVAAGAIARQLLEHVGIAIASHVTAIGGARLSGEDQVPFEAIAALPPDAAIPCVDPRAAEAMVAAIDLAREDGDTLGGVFEVVVHGVPPGLGSYAQWDRRLDGRLGKALLSIPAVKAVSIGAGWESAALRGSEVHDEIVPDEPGAGATSWGLRRPTNRAGGIEGGVSNGEEIRVTARMKPLSTLSRPLASVDLETGAPGPAAIERTDTCAVPAAAVVGEAVVALVLADAFMEKFGQDSMAEIDDNYGAWRRRLRQRFGRGAQASTSEER